MRINYISNLRITQDRGGWDGMNKNVYEQLAKFLDINLVDSINPPLFKYQRILSKLQRYLKIPALFPGFSIRRLRRFAALAERGMTDDAQLNFFHGSTCWIMVKNKLPYACYLDASFSTYLAIYHKRDKFIGKTIFELEKKFLQGAQAVFFSSQYSLDQTKNDYNLTGKNFYNVGLGGSLSFNEKLSYCEKKGFVFVGHDYYGKGGDLVAEAFRVLSNQTHGLQMTFVGESPPANVLKIPGVVYAGYLNKSKESDLEKLKNILMSSIALVLPTSRDLTPLVILEAGYYGCPSIASNAYGIPDMIGDYGYLCEMPIQVQELAKAMVQMKSRKTSPDLIRNFYLKKFTWEATGKIIKSILLDQKM
jgi:glycosyltransferase involved in cell wall biosynthesis